MTEIMTKRSAVNLLAGTTQSHAILLCEIWEKMEGVGDGGPNQASRLARLILQLFVVGRGNSFRYCFQNITPDLLFASLGGAQHIVEYRSIDCIFCGGCRGRFCISTRALLPSEIKKCRRFRISASSSSPSIYLVLLINLISSPILVRRICDYSRIHHLSSALAMG